MITAKLKKDKKTLTISAKKETPSDTTSYFLVFYNNFGMENDGLKIIKVETKDNDSIID